MPPWLSILGYAIGAVIHELADYLRERDRDRRRVKRVDRAVRHVKRVQNLGTK